MIIHLKYIYLIKPEQPPLTRKEKTRLYSEFKKLREVHMNVNVNVKL